MIETQDALNKALGEIEELQKSDDDPAEEDKILKSADPEVVELVKAARAEADEAKEIAKAERKARIRRDLLEKADSDYGDIGASREDLADVLQYAGESFDADTMEKLHRVLGVANEAAQVGKLYEEHGGAGEAETDAERQLLTKAEEIRKNDPNLTEEQAFDQALTENPDLYYESLKGGK